MPAKLIRSLYNLTPAQRGGVVTIGNFDGVHIGHQQLITKVVAKAKQMQVPSLAITFEPHVFEYFAGESLTIPRLTRLREKFLVLTTFGIENVLILPFNHAMATMSAREFVQKILHDALQAKHIIVGDDFHFGERRQGNFALLKSMGEELGFTVEAMPTMLLDGERVSSTRVRQVLSTGNHALAERLLGRPYAMMGRISFGDQLGRQWGYPTANIFLHRKLTPVHGVYTVYVHGVANRPWPGAANVGMRPTVNGTRTLLEVHLLDFNREIYGHYVQVDFCEKLRDEVRYANVDLLIEQIGKDVDAARQYFQAQGTL